MTVLTSDFRDEREGYKPVYRYFFYHLISDQLLLELPMTSVSWGRTIRRAGTFSGTIHVSPENQQMDLFWGTMEWRTAIYVTRNGIPVWGGIISDRSYDAVTGELQVSAVSFEAWLYRRVIWHTVSYNTTVDQYQVVRNLITLAQTDFSGVGVPGDGVTQFPAAASIGLEVEATNSGKHQDTLTVGGNELRSLGEIIEEFSDNLGGFEYNIEITPHATDPNKFRRVLVFRDTPPSQLKQGETYSGTRPGIDQNFLEFPGNISQITFDESIEEAATRYFVTGKTPETDGGSSSSLAATPRGAWNNDAYLSTGWPLLEFVESSKHSEVTLQTTLENYAKQYGRRARPPVATWSVTINGALDPVVGTYRPGDWCRILTTDPFLKQRLTLESESLTGLVKRIGAFSVTVPDTEQTPETVSLTLIDEWNDEGNV